MYIVVSNEINFAPKQFRKFQIRSDDELIPVEFLPSSEKRDNVFEKTEDTTKPLGVFQFDPPCCC